MLPLPPLFSSNDYVQLYYWMIFKNDGTGVITQTSSSATKDYPITWKKMNGGYLLEYTEKNTGAGFMAEVSNDGKSFFLTKKYIFTKSTA